MVNDWFKWRKGIPLLEQAEPFDNTSIYLCKLKAINIFITIDVFLVLKQSNLSASYTFRPQSLLTTLSIRRKYRCMRWNSTTAIPQEPQITLYHLTQSHKWYIDHRILGLASALHWFLVNIVKVHNHLNIRHGQNKEARCTLKDIDAIRKRSWLS